MTADRPVATCPRDGEPLVGSFEVPQTEWLCMVCGNRLAFFSARSATRTPERDARYEELRLRYVAGERP